MAFVIGLIVGSLAGMTVTALCVSASNADDETERFTTGTTAYDPEDKDEKPEV